MHNNTKPKFLFVHGVHANTMGSYFVKIDSYMEPYLKKSFDTVSIYDWDNLDLAIYDVIIFTTCILVPLTNQIQNKIRTIASTCSVAIFFHDLHDYSFGSSRISHKKCLTKINGQLVNLPLALNTPTKKFLKSHCEQLNVKYFISYYDCPEYDFFATHFKPPINNFYIVNHGYSKEIFKPQSIPKEYDILFYGSIVASTYPFRSRLLKMFQRSNLRIRFIHSGENICEDKLCELINKSWLCIACVSNFSYFVIKYLEISACNAVVIGDINSQGLQILNNNLVWVDNSMSDNKILTKAKYYLDHKEILAAISFNKLKDVLNENYEFMEQKLRKICDDMMTHTECSYSYDSYNSYKTHLHDKTNKFDELHQCKLISVNFLGNLIEPNTLSEQVLEPGLYVFTVENTNSHHFEVRTESNLLLTDIDTRLCDQINLHLYYVPFRLDIQSKIKLIFTGDISKIQLHQIRI